MKYLPILLLALACTASSAQERQVPLDREGDLVRIGSKLERDLRLFPDYAGFREAKLFQIADTTFALEIFCRRNGQLLKYRNLLPSPEIDALRREVSARIPSRRPPALLDRSGRSRFLLRTFLLSYGFYSWALPFALDLNGQAAQVTALLTGSAGFIAPFTFTNQHPVSQTAAGLSAHLGTTGIFHGAFLSGLLFGEDVPERGTLALALAGSAGGLVGGFKMAQRSTMTAGSAELIGSAGNYGMLMGLGAAHLIDLYEGENLRSVAALALTGSGLGYWGGSILSRQHPYTRGDAETQDTIGILSAYLASSLLFLATDSENARAYTTTAMSGSALGLGLGHRLLKDENFTTGESRMMMLGAVGGMLMSTAIGVLIDASDRASAFLAASGAASGFWFTFRTFAGENSSREEDVALAPRLFLTRSLSDTPLLTFRYTF